MSEELPNGEPAARTINGSCPACGQEVEIIVGKKQEIECSNCGETLILMVDTAVDRRLKIGSDTRM